MNKIVLATNNKHKLKEFRDILNNYEILSLEDINYTDEIEETGTTFLENATIKTDTIYNFLKDKEEKYIIIADDSGLCVNSLDGAPGVYSARYAGVHGNNEANRKKLIKDLKGKNKDAYFICTIVVCYPDFSHKNYVGKTEGTIIDEERGKKDFGYDCIFYSKELNKTFGEATEEEKNSVSHRGRAIGKMVKEL